MTPASINCVFTVVFGGRNISVTLVKPFTFGCAVQLSETKAIFLLLFVSDYPVSQPRFKNAAGHWSWIYTQVEIFLIL